MLANVCAVALLAALAPGAAAQSVTSYAPLGPPTVYVSNGLLWVTVDYPQWTGYFQNTLTLQPGAPAASQTLGRLRAACPSSKGPPCTQAQQGSLADSRRLLTRLRLRRPVTSRPCPVAGTLQGRARVLPCRLRAPAQAPASSTQA